MKHLLFVATLVVAALIAAWPLLSPHPRHPVSPYERWVDANHLRVEVKGHWEDVQLMPLADHLCQSGQPLFERYCNDPSSNSAN